MAVILPHEYGHDGGPITPCPLDANRAAHLSVRFEIEAADGISAHHALTANAVGTAARNRDVDLLSVTLGKRKQPPAIKGEAAGSQGSMIESEDLFALADVARFQRYRDFSDEAVRASANAKSPEIGEGYLRLACHWAEIAPLLEQAMRLKGQVHIPAWRPVRIGNDSGK